MTQVVIAVAAMIVLISLSVRANLLFKNEARLPMQWQLDGTVIWTAPRRMALAFTPVVSAVVLAFTVAMSFVSQPRPGQGWLLIPAVLFVAFIFIGIQTFHIWMMKKHLSRRGQD